MFPGPVNGQAIKQPRLVIYWAVEAGAVYHKSPAAAFRLKLQTGVTPEAAYRVGQAVGDRQRASM